MQDAALHRSGIVIAKWVGGLAGARECRSDWHPSERGILFDVGHGAGSFTFDVARRALGQGLLPGTISSDIHAWKIAGSVYDLATTASKLLHWCIPLAEVVRRDTVNENPP